jgi:hypothetical protein
MYKGILNKNKKIVETNLHNFNEATYRPTGIYDQYILCNECDNEVIGSLESYAAKNFYDNKNIEITVDENEHIINLMFKDIDYKKFKLFLVSILWRASISKHKIFSEVNLGIKYEEVARKMIFEGNPGRQDDFPTCILGLISHQNLVLKTIIAPRKIKDDGNTAYMFFINGLFYWFNISSYNMEDIFNRVPLDENNEMTIGILKNKIGDDFYDIFVGRKIRTSKKY